MFSQGGLHIGPTTGNVQSDPAALIGESALSIAHVNQLRNEIDAKASTNSLSSGLATKQDVLGASSDLEVSTLEAGGFPRAGLLKSIDGYPLSLANAMGAVGITVSNSNGHVALSLAHLKRHLP